MGESSTRASDEPQPVERQPIESKLSTLPSASAMRAVSTNVAEHYVWGEKCDGWHLIRTDSLSVISERMPPGTAETAHRHHRAQQFFFVLSGELTLESQGMRITLSAREGLHVPPMLVHQALNVSDAPVEFLVISEPKSHGDRENV